MCRDGEAREFLREKIEGKGCRDEVPKCNFLFLNYHVIGTKFPPSCLTVLLISIEEFLKHTGEFFSSNYIYFSQAGAMDQTSNHVLKESQFFTT